ncbi:MAG: hypothetical protein NT027_20340 [Proteobacteria bacterium]|nr:hypothetical protein [Pseudomonadota bacterium]
MARLSLVYMLIGFVLVFLSASGGVFIALDLTYKFISNDQAVSWLTTLQTSSHGHTALFGVVDILIGLTLPYVIASERMKLIQFYAVVAGSIAMGPGMIARAFIGPEVESDVLGIVMGCMLSAWLFAIGYHIFGLSKKIYFSKYRV